MNIAVDIERREWLWGKGGGLGGVLMEEIKESAASVG